MENKVQRGVKDEGKRRGKRMKYTTKGGRIMNKRRDEPAAGCVSQANLGYWNFTDFDKLDLGRGGA